MGCFSFYALQVSWTDTTKARILISLMVSMMPSRRFQQILQKSRSLEPICAFIELQPNGQKKKVTQAAKKKIIIAQKAKAKAAKTKAKGKWKEGEEPFGK
jgi:hypothetical protein